jgi:hypothetical protein
MGTAFAPGAAVVSVVSLEGEGGVDDVLAEVEIGCNLGIDVPHIDTGLKPGLGFGLTLSAFLSVKLCCQLAE